MKICVKCAAVIMLKILYNMLDIQMHFAKVIIYIYIYIYIYCDINTSPKKHNCWPTQKHSKKYAIFMSKIQLQYNNYISTDQTPKNWRNDIWYSVPEQLRKEITTRGYSEIIQFRSWFKDVRTLTQATRTWSGISSIITVYRFALPLFEITKTGTRLPLPHTKTYQIGLPTYEIIWNGPMYQNIFHTTVSIKRDAKPPNCIRLLKNIDRIHCLAHHILLCVLKLFFFVMVTQAFGKT